MSADGFDAIAWEERIERNRFLVTFASTPRGRWGDRVDLNAYPSHAEARAASRAAILRAIAEHYARNA